MGACNSAPRCQFCNQRPIAIQYALVLIKQNSGWVSNAEETYETAVLSVDIASNLHTLPPHHCGFNILRSISPIQKHLIQEYDSIEGAIWSFCGLLQGNQSHNNWGEAWGVRKKDEIAVMCQHRTCSCKGSKAQQALLPKTNVKVGSLDPTQPKPTNKVNIEEELGAPPKYSK